MATRQKRVPLPQIKRETEANDGARSSQHPLIDDQASDDLDKAEARLEERKNRLKKESPNKVSTKPSHHTLGQESFPLERQPVLVRRRRRWRLRRWLSWFIGKYNSFFETRNLIPCSSMTSLLTIKRSSKNWLPKKRSPEKTANALRRSNHSTKRTWIWLERTSASTTRKSQDLREMRRLKTRHQKITSSKSLPKLTRWRKLNLKAPKSKCKSMTSLASLRSRSIKSRLNKRSTRKHR